MDPFLKKNTYIDTMHYATLHYNLSDITNREREKVLLEMLGLGNKVIFADDIRDDIQSCFQYPEGFYTDYGSTNATINNMRAYVITSDTEIHALLLVPVTNGIWCLQKSTNGHIYYLAVRAKLDTRYRLLVSTIGMIFLVI